jgi:hypothetical protein
MISSRAHALMRATTRSRRAVPSLSVAWTAVVGGPTGHRRMVRANLDQPVRSPRSSRSASHQNAQLKHSASARAPAASSVHAQLDAVLERPVEVGRGKPGACACRATEDPRPGTWRGCARRSGGAPCRPGYSSSFLCWSAIRCSKVSSSRTTLPIRCSDAVSTYTRTPRFAARSMAFGQLDRRRGGRKRAGRPHAGSRRDRRRARLAEDGALQARFERHRRHRRSPACRGIVGRRRSQPAPRGWLGSGRGSLRGEGG